MVSLLAGLIEGGSHVEEDEKPERHESTHQLPWPHVLVVVTDNQRKNKKTIWEFSSPGGSNDSIGGSGGEGRSSPGPKFLHFHEVLGKIWKIIVWRPFMDWCHFWEILDPPLDFLWRAPTLCCPSLKLKQKQKPMKFLDPPMNVYHHKKIQNPHISSLFNACC